MKKSNLFLLLFTLSILTIACNDDDVNITGSGDMITEERDFSNDSFTGVNIDGLMKVEITQAQEFKVTVMGFENIVPLVITQVSNNTLSIDLQDGNYDEIGDLTVFVEMPELYSINKDGIGNTEVTQFVYLSNDLKTMDIELDGIGNIEITGDSYSLLNMSSSGIGEFKGDSFWVSELNIDQSGVGNTYVACANQLSGSLSGIGNLYYKGTPTINIDDSGIGDVIDNN